MNCWRILMVLALAVGLAAAGLPPAARAEQIQMTAFTGMVADGSGHGYPLYAAVIANDGAQNYTAFTNPMDGMFTMELASGLYEVTIIPYLEGYLPYVQAGVDITAPLNVALQVSPSCEAPGYGPWVENTLFNYDFTLGQQGFAIDIPGSLNPSWAYGLPLEGPVSALSVWGTNLTGDYNPLEDSLLVSPVMDTSAAPNGFWLQWNHWYQMAYPGDLISVEAQNALGLWQPVWTITTPESGNWVPEIVYLDGQYAHTNFQFRFRLTENDDGTLATGWYIMNARLYTAGCAVLPGGLIWGHAFDANTAQPVDGALVISSGVPPFQVITQTWRGDGGHQGFYMGFQQTPPEQITLTASKLYYGTAVTGPITVPENGLYQQPIDLPAGVLDFNPGDLGNLDFGFLGGGEALLKLENTGTLPVNFEVVELPVFGSGTLNALPAADEASKAATFYAFDQISHSLVSFSSSTPGVLVPVAPYPQINVVGADFLPGEPQQLYAIDSYANRLIRLNTATGWLDRVGSLPPPTDQNWVGLTAGADGWLYGLASSIPLSLCTVVQIDPVTLTAVRQIELKDSTGTFPQFAWDIALDDAGNLYGVNPGSDRLSRFDLQTGLELEHVIIPFNSERSESSLEFNSADGLLYLSMQPGMGNPALYSVDFAGGQFTSLGEQTGTLLAGLAQPESGRADVPWISADQVSGNIPAGGILEITFVFTPGGLAPGTYQAYITLATDAPDPIGGNQILGRGRIPITMQVVAPTLLIETPETAYNGQTIEAVIVFDADGELIGGAIEAQAAIENALPPGFTYVPDSLLADYGTASYDSDLHAILWNTPADLVDPPEVVMITYRAVVTGPAGAAQVSQIDLTYGDSGEYTATATDMLTIGRAVFLPVMLK
ncbi:MAG TPA: hypothetical protein PK454_10705 [Anaerolineaceae bacterium]|nr:hypothetical protein [Anaerolineaceae bacterium]